MRETFESSSKPCHHESTPVNRFRNLRRLCKTAELQPRFARSLSTTGEPLSNPCWNAKPGMPIIVSAPQVPGGLAPQSIDGSVRAIRAARRQHLGQRMEKGIRHILGAWAELQ